MQTTLEFTDKEIEEIYNLLKRILRDNEDAIQKVWEKLIAEGITDRTEIADIAKKIRSYETYNAIYKESRFMSMDASLPSCEDKTMHDVIASPEAEDSSEYGTRSLQNGCYGSPKAMEEIISREYKVVCKFCDSTNVIKNGKRGIADGVQYWLCRTCGRGFVANGALPRMRYPKYIIREAVRLRMGGCTLSSIRRRLYAQYKIDMRGTGMLCRWFKELSISPPTSTKDKHWRRDVKDLKEGLAQLEQGVVYTASQILTTLGYAERTKITAIQVYKRGLIRRDNGGWVVEI